MVILVGPERKEFHVPRKILSGNVEFCNAICKGPLKEFPSAVVNVPVDDIEGFSYVLKWLSFATLGILHATSSVNDDIGFQSRLRSANLLCRVYLIANKYPVRGLQEQAISDLRRVFLCNNPENMTVISGELITMVYGNVPNDAPSSQLQHAITNYVAKGVMSQGYVSGSEFRERGGNNPRFLWDLVEAMRASAQKGKGRSFHRVGVSSTSLAC